MGIWLALLGFLAVVVGLVKIVISLIKKQPVRKWVYVALSGPCLFIAGAIVDITTEDSDVTAPEPPRSAASTAAKPPAASQAPSPSRAPSKKGGAEAKRSAFKAIEGKLEALEKELEAGDPIAVQKGARGIKAMYGKRFTALGDRATKLIKAADEKIDVKAGEFLAAAEAAKKAGNLPEAEQTIAKILSVRPRHSGALALKQQIAKEKAAEEAEATKKEDTKAYKQAVRLMKRKKYEEALPLLMKISPAFEKAPDVRNRIARCKLRTTEWTVGNSAKWKVDNVKEIGKRLRSYNMFQKAKRTQGRFVQVDFTVENLTKKQQRMTSGMYKIVDSMGREFKEVDGLGMHVPKRVNTVGLLDQLSSNVPYSFRTIFELPSDATGLKLMVSDLEVFGRQWAEIPIPLDK